MVCFMIKIIIACFCCLLVFCSQGAPKNQLCRNHKDVFLMEQSLLSEKSDTDSCIGTGVERVVERVGR